MKFLLMLLAGASALTAATALAQTATPRNTVPSPQTVITPDMRNAGSPQASSHDAKAPGMSRRDQKRLRKMGKVKSTHAGTKRSKRQ